MPDPALSSIFQHCAHLDLQPTPKLITVSIQTQSLSFHAGEKREKCYPVSSSKNPPSCLQDSFGTPLGLHCIAEKIGQDIPQGGVLKGRVYTGRHFSGFPPEEQEKNLITTRILRLQGLEPGKNAGDGCDSFDRYIYIHGTNREKYIGTPQSHGCILLTNHDIVDLYDRVKTGTMVWIY